MNRSMRRISWLLLAGFACAACGGDDAAGAAAGGGEVVAPWDGYCVATFSAPFEIVDSFGDVELSIQSGDRYLLGAGSGFASATIIFIGANGPVELDLDYEASAPPFTSSCMEGATRELTAVFVDTVVYADEARTMPVCTLAAGTTAPGSGPSFALVGDLFSSTTYQVELGGLAPSCSGATEGFVQSVNITIGTTRYGGVPFATLLAPM